jgi:glutathione S-transferase
MMTKPSLLTLISFDLCPYVQRAAIVLAEKDIAFERIDIDLAEKPDWFLAISPLGKVPVLKVGDDVLFESSVIVEYLDETRGAPLHPADPLARARHRAWMEFGSSILGDIWVIETSADRETFESKAKVLREKFVRLEAVLAEGPYFAGTRFAMVDAVFAPAFRYFDTFDTIADLGILDGLPKVAAWRRALAARSSVVKAVSPAYPEKLMAFLTRHNGYIVNGAARVRAA